MTSYSKTYIAIAEAYGAAPGTDSTAAFQRALNVANTLGSVWVLTTTPGTYTLSDHLLAYPHTKFECASKAVVLQKVAGATNNVCMIRNAFLLSTVSVVEIVGGTWDGNYSGGNTAQVNSDKTSQLTGVQGELSFIGVNDLRVRDLVVQNTFGFAVQAIGTRMQFKTLNWGTGTQKDGLHINGPSKHIWIEDLYGYAVDDFVALNAWDWAASSPSTGTIDDVFIRNIRSVPPTGVATTAAFVKLLPGTRGGTQGDVTNVVIDGLYGEMHDHAIKIFNDTDPQGSTPSGVGVVNGLEVRNINVALTNASNLLDIRNNCDGIAMRNIRQPTPATTQGAIVGMVNGYTANKVLIDGLDYLGTAGYDNAFNIKGQINNFTLTNSQLLGVNNGSVSNGADTCAFNINGGGWIKNLFVSNVRQNYGGSFIYNQSNASSNVMNVYLANCDFYSIKHVFFAQQPMTVRAHGCNFEVIQNDIGRIDSAAFIGSFSDCTATYNGGVPFTKVNTGTIRLINSDLPVDVSNSIITTFSAGDTVMNSNGAVACGVGRVTSNGTNWKNVYTGATY